MRITVMKMNKLICNISYFEKISQSPLLPVYTFSPAAPEEAL
jgi:hypothetical protein